MQIKTFTAWVNSHLKREGLAVEDLSKDFSDGVKLIKLIEIISEDTLGKYKQKPVRGSHGRALATVRSATLARTPTRPPRSAPLQVGKFQKMENLNLPLKYINDFLKSQKISNQYSAENILEENTTLILGMVWSLILRFNVQQISEGDRTAKEGLLLWAQNKARVQRARPHRLVVCAHARVVAHARYCGAPKRTSTVSRTYALTCERPHSHFH